MPKTTRTNTKQGKRKKSTVTKNHRRTRRRVSKPRKSRKGSYAARTRRSPSRVVVHRFSTPTFHKTIHHVSPAPVETRYVYAPPTPTVTKLLPIPIPAPVPAPAPAPAPAPVPASHTTGPVLGPGNTCSPPCPPGEMCASGICLDAADLAANMAH